MRLRETSIPRGTTETCSLHRENVSGWCVTRAYAGEAIAEARTARMLVPRLREDVCNFADSSGPLRAAAPNDDTTVRRSQRALYACLCPTSPLLSQLLPRLSSFNALNIPPSRGIAIPRLRLSLHQGCTLRLQFSPSRPLWRLCRDREAGRRRDAAATASRIALSDTRQPFLFPSVRARR